MNPKFFVEQLNKKFTDLMQGKDIPQSYVRFHEKWMQITQIILDSEAADSQKNEWLIKMFSSFYNIMFFSKTILQEGNQKGSSLKPLINYAVNLPEAYKLPHAGIYDNAFVRLGELSKFGNFDQFINFDYWIDFIDDHAKKMGVSDIALAKIWAKVAEATLQEWQDAYQLAEANEEKKVELPPTKEITEISIEADDFRVMLEYINHKLEKWMANEFTCSQGDLISEFKTNEAKVAIETTIGLSEKELDFMKFMRNYYLQIETLTAKEQVVEIQRALRNRKEDIEWNRALLASLKKLFMTIITPVRKANAGFADTLSSEQLKVLLRITDALTGKPDIKPAQTQQDNYGITPLHKAVAENQLHLVGTLLGKNADIEARDRSGRSPLQIAVSKGNLDIVKVLIDRKANLEAKNNDDETALHVAAKTGRLDITRLLVNSNANLYAQDDRDQTPLQVAYNQGHQRVFEFLLTKMSLQRAVKQENVPLIELMLSSGVAYTPQLRSRNSATSTFLSLFENFSRAYAYKAKGFDSSTPKSEQLARNLGSLLDDFSHHTNSFTMFKKPPFDPQFLRDMKYQLQPFIQQDKKLEELRDLLEKLKKKWSDITTPEYLFLTFAKIIVGQEISKPALAEEAKPQVASRQPRK